MPKIKLDKELYEKLTKVSQQVGYASTEEFITHILEKAVNTSDTEETDADVLSRLQGLGYIS